jgi:hypothetical protein
MSKKLLTDTIQQVGDIDVGLNLYLVKVGVRKACLIEFANVNDAIGKRAIVAAKTLNLRTAWENKQFKRVLVAQKKDAQFKRALTNEVELGKILGFQCPGEMGERYTVNVFATWDKQKADVLTEACRSPNPSDYDQLLASLNELAAFPGFHVELNIKDNGLTYGNVAKFLQTATDDDLWTFRESLVSQFENFSSESKIVKLLTAVIATRKQFLLAIHTHKQTIGALASLLDAMPNFVEESSKWEAFYLQVETGALP